MKITFKGQQLTTTKCVNNIIRVYKRNENPTDWYHKASVFAAIDMSLCWNVDLTKCCGILAALSPLKSWELNKKLALDYITTGTAGHTKYVLNKCKRIMGSDGEVDTICQILNGNKITSFFLNIFDNTLLGHVTIDRHAQDIALGRVLSEDKRGMTTKQYRFFENCYIIAAAKLSKDGVKVHPTFVQSATWEQWRKEKKSK